ncbi:hypothetical protein CDD83_7725 [Cordyceps sp. RAO-2017]|nr:hypothetical protein CDD83_7725 [Cordyceps sp. RAO-2017]
MDHHRPSDGHITLGMVRIKTNASRPLGNLIVNPGGPGSSPVSLLIREKRDELVSLNLTFHYNIIAPDPRGVGISHPVKCDASLAHRRVSSYIANQSDFDKLVARNKALGESCAQLTGPALNFLDTVSAAKDLDLIRQALGDEKLNFMGFSYGTQLGSQYAELFPERVGRMVLDGVLDHSQNDIDGLMTETVTLENSFDRFCSWCNGTSRCVFHGQNLPAIFDAMVNQANEKPIPAPGCRSVHEATAGGGQACRSDVTGYELISNMQSSLTEQARWTSLSEALLEARDGNATRLSSRFLVSNPSPLAESGNEFAHTAISCQDWRRGDGKRGGADMLAELLAARAMAPHTRGINEMFDIKTSCVGWPTPLTNPPRALCRQRLARAPPILVASALHDPSTSIAWAVGLRAQMPTAVSIFRNGYGHTSYWDYGDMQKAIDAFFVEGTQPADLTAYAS